jgi:hypothetical protein
VTAAAQESSQATLPKPAPLLHRVFGMYRPAVLVAASITLIVLGAFGITQWRESATAGAASITAINEQLRLASFFTERRIPGDLARAKQQYEQTLSLDPSSARAWAGLCERALARIRIG